MTLAEGWYLMSVEELERELARARGQDASPTSAVPLSIDEALRYRNAGNVPDAEGRSLRLVLHVHGAEDVRNLSTRRAEFEPDFHDEPKWRVEGSVPVNVVPLRIGKVDPVRERPWWEEPEVAELEAEWSRAGTIAGIKVPDEYRSFVYKTVLSLRAAKREITVDSVSSSVARWLTPSDAAALRSALENANR